MTKIINLTPEIFVDLFVLCLSWQWEPKSLVHTWTTVDKVVKILFNLGVITESQVAALRHPIQGRPYQSALYRRTAVVIRGCADRSAIPYGPSPQTQFVLRQPAWMCVVADPTKMGVPLTRLVRGKPIHLTYMGACYAEGLTERFAPWVTREAYLADTSERVGTQLDDHPRPPRPKKKAVGPANLITRLW